MSRELQDRDLQTGEPAPWKRRKKPAPWDRRFIPGRKKALRIHRVYGSVSMELLPEEFAERVRANLRQLSEQSIFISGNSVSSAVLVHEFAHHAFYLRSQGHWIPQSVQTLLAPDERRQLPEEGDDTYHYLEEIVPVSFDPEGPTSRKESSDKITSTNFPQKTGETERLTRLNKQLSTEIELLKAELRKNVPYLQLYRFGAGAVSLSIISLICWLVSGVSMPFHPAFAITTLPVGIAFMAMSWITRKNAGKSEL